MKKKKIAIVGFGRFGRTLLRLLEGDFEVGIYDVLPLSSLRTELEGKAEIIEGIENIYASDVIYYAVPISCFVDVIEAHKKYFRPNNLLIDILSVKLYPKKIFEFSLEGLDVRAMLIHPMFGPDSSRDGFTNLPLIMDRFTAREEDYIFWKNFFSKKGLSVVEMSAEKHDRLAANSQGVTHLIGRILDDMGYDKTIIDSNGAKKLLEVKEQTCNDTFELFIDLQQYNPYTKHMRSKLREAYKKINRLLISENAVENTYGIQGGKGSFNEQALISYLAQRQISKYKISYLYTTENVLKYLNDEDINYEFLRYLIPQEDS